MKFPFVRRSKYDHLLSCLQKMCEGNIALQDEVKALRKENETILGNACQLADIEREDRKLERSHFEAILTNMRGE